MIINGALDLTSQSLLHVNKVRSANKQLDEIESVLIEKMADKISLLQEVKNYINTALTDPLVVSDPAALAKVQAVMADYQLTIELYQKIASSGIKTVDTLVKS